MSTANSLLLSTTPVAMTCTLAALGASAARESTMVDNTSLGYTDASVILMVQLGSATGADNAIYVYAYGSPDGTMLPTYDILGTELTGSDAAVTTTPSNLPLMVTKSVGATTSSTINIYVPSIALGFGGIMPKKWGIVVDNRAGAFSSTTGAATFTCNYVGFYQQVSY
jgi:hypothetical protein